MQIIGLILLIVACIYFPPIFFVILAIVGFSLFAD